ncbi:Gfo/Idh/MocA family oxidoreductase [Streptomyces sp. NPDC001817]|uniref:Gfo/Idh/MocA family oxidoreductase n=1 Tax=Streptomyces sp. NPDC001817 TaxID=3154398 RepID=UPI00331E801D
MSATAATDVDVVSVATGHTAHLACARLTLECGKHTLVEKPLALDAHQATEIAELAAARGLFCAEALWTFFLPRFDVVRQVPTPASWARSTPSWPATASTPLGFTDPRTAHDGLHIEAAETARCITSGRLQTSCRTPADSITTLRVMDDIRTLCGIPHPPR